MCCTHTLLENIDSYEDKFHRVGQFFGVPSLSPVKLSFRATHENRQEGLFMWIAKEAAVGNIPHYSISLACRSVVKDSSIKDATHV